MTRAFVTELGSVLSKRDPSGLARAAVIAYGTACAAAGYIHGSFTAPSHLSERGSGTALLASQVAASNAAEQTEHAR